MEIKDLFYTWVPLYIRIPVLIIFLFAFLVANGIFLGNVTDTYSSLGVYAEPYTMASNGLYIGMGLGLVFHLRLKMRFTNKTLLVGGILSLLVLNTICALTSSPQVVIIACFLLGFTKISALIEVYIIWLLIWSKTGDRARLYPFVYFVALAGLYFVTWLTTYYAAAFNWRYAYIVILILLAVCLLLALVFVEDHSLRRKVPLYQLDWQGLLMLGVTLMLLNYVVVYGKVEDWFTSRRIIFGALASGLALLLFIKRELTVKRPVLNLTIFSVPNFKVGLLYFLLLGLFIPSTFQNALTGNVLRYEAIRNAEVNLYLIPGLLAGAAMCYAWFYYKWDAQLMIMLGFSAFVIYYIMLYNSFANDYALHDFWLPAMIKGFGVVVIYVAAGLYTASNMGMPMVLKASGTIIIFRSFLGSGIWTAIYNELLYAGRIRHYNYLAGLTDGQTLNEGNPGELYRNLQLQSILAASKEVTGYIIWAGIVIVIVMVAVQVYRRLFSGWSS